MATNTGSVLVVCRPDNQEHVVETLQPATADVPIETVTSVPDAQSAIETTDVICIVSFVEVRDARGNEWVSGIELYEDVAERSANIPFVLISETGNDDIVQMALDAGVSNLVRPWPGARPERDLREAVEQVVTRRRIYTTVDAVTDGNLDVRIDTADLEGVFREIATRINGMIDSIQDDLRRRERVAGDLDSSIQELRSRSEQVAESSEDISDGTRDMTARIEQANSEVSTLSATVEEIAATSDDVAQTSEDAVEAANDGQQSAESAMEAMENIDEAATGVAEDVTTLQERVDEIDEIVELINDIADQTNILALNANIEAARAGKSGDGFAVVANEVKNLATEAQEHAETIEDMLEGVQRDTETTVESLEQATDEIDTGVSEVEATMDALDDIAEKIRAATTGMEEVANATDDQAASTEEVASMMDEIAAMAEDTADEIQAIAGANSEQVAEISQLEQSMRQLVDDRTSQPVELADD
ncbi:MAG: methyl-accepting chemotaxis protein [Halapricum sp.]